MVTSNRISKLMESSSWIRAMFEEGERLKKVYGADAIFDFTLGNPIAEPPQELKQELCDMVHLRRRTGRTATCRTAATRRYARR